jgi:hypothetical protein
MLVAGQTGTAFFAVEEVPVRHVSSWQDRRLRDVAAEIVHRFGRQRTDDE